MMETERSDRMKLVTVIGARPQIVKAAALSREICRHPDLNEIIVHTGQHFDANMSAVHFETMQLRPPDYNLNISSLSHGAMTGRMLEAIERVLLAEKPDYVVVYGDTNSTIPAALAAKKLFMPVVHIEAGLRSFNMRMPEEINRILTDRISDLLFCPTETAVRNLENEGYRNFDCEIHKSGDIMQDAALHYSQIAAERSTIIADLDLDRFIFCTIHRPENTDDPSRLASIIDALNAINRDVPILLPLHPRTRKILTERGVTPRFRVTEPVGYLDALQLLKHCSLVVTDSGGLQKEAFFFGKHCVTLRDETEWLELVELGFNVLAGADPESIHAAATRMLDKTSDFTLDLYGRGRAAENIVTCLREHYCRTH